MPKDFGKNLVKSFTGTVGGSIFENLTPELKTAIARNKETIKESYDNRDKRKLKDRIKDSKQFGSILDSAKLLKNTFIEDVKSGKWFGDNARYEAALGKALEENMGLSDDDFGDDDEGGGDYGDDLFGDDDGSGSVEDFDSESYGSIDLDVDNSSSMNITDNRSHINNVTQVNNMVDNRVIGSVLSTLSSKMDDINSSVNSILDYHNDTLTEHNDKQIELLENISSNLDKLYKVEEKEQNGTSKLLDELFKHDGFLDLKTYFNQLTAGIKDIFAEGGEFDTLIGSQLKSIAADPIGQGIGMAVGAMIPETVKDMGEKFQDTLSSTMKGIVYQLAAGKQGKGGWLQQTLGKRLGLNLSLNDNTDSSKVNYKKDAIPFDGETKRVITMVIPNYLAKILSNVQGISTKMGATPAPETMYDISTGKIRFVKDVKKQVEKEEKSRLQSNYSAVMGNKEFSKTIEEAGFDRMSDEDKRIYDHARSNAERIRKRNKEIEEEARLTVKHADLVKDEKAQVLAKQEKMLKEFLNDRYQAKGLKGKNLRNAIDNNLHSENIVREFLTERYQAKGLKGKNLRNAIDANLKSFMTDKQAYFDTFQDTRLTEQEARANLKNDEKYQAKKNEQKVLKDKLFEKYKKEKNLTDDDKKQLTKLVENDYDYITIKNEIKDIEEKAFANVRSQKRDDSKIKGILSKNKEYTKNKAELSKFEGLEKSTKDKGISNYKTAILKVADSIGSTFNGNLTKEQYYNALAAGNDENDIRAFTYFASQNPQLMRDINEGIMNSNREKLEMSNNPEQNTLKDQLNLFNDGKTRDDKIRENLEKTKVDKEYLKKLVNSKYLADKAPKKKTFKQILGNRKGVRANFEASLQYMSNTINRGMFKINQGLSSVIFGNANGMGKNFKDKLVDKIVDDKDSAISKLADTLGLRDKLKKSRQKKQDEAIDAQIESLKTTQSIEAAVNGLQTQLQGQWDEDKLISKEIDKKVGGILKEGTSVNCFSVKSKGDSILANLYAFITGREMDATKIKNDGKTMADGKKGIKDKKDKDKKDAKEAKEQNKVETDGDSKPLSKEAVREKAKNKLIEIARNKLNPLIMGKNELKDDEGKDLDKDSEINKVLRSRLKLGFKPIKEKFKEVADKFKDIMFGEKDKEGKRPVGKWAKANEGMLKRMGIGTVAGGVIGKLFFNPIIGAGLGILVSSEHFQEAMFGDGEDSVKTILKTALIGKSTEVSKEDSFFHVLKYRIMTSIINPVKTRVKDFLFDNKDKGTEGIIHKAGRSIFGFLSKEDKNGLDIYDKMSNIVDTYKVYLKMQTKRLFNFLFEKIHQGVGFIGNLIKKGAERVDNFLYGRKRNGKKSFFGKVLGFFNRGISKAANFVIRKPIDWLNNKANSVKEKMVSRVTNDKGRIDIKQAQSIGIDKFVREKVANDYLNENDNNVLTDKLRGVYTEKTRRSKSKKKRHNKNKNNVKVDPKRGTFVKNQSLLDVFKTPEEAANFIRGTKFKNEYKDAKKNNFMSIFNPDMKRYSSDDMKLMKDKVLHPEDYDDSGVLTLDAAKKREEASTAELKKGASTGEQYVVEKVVTKIDEVNETLSKGICGLLTDLIHAVDPNSDVTNPLANFKTDLEKRAQEAVDKTDPTKKTEEDEKEEDKGFIGRVFGFFRNRNKKGRDGDTLEEAKAKVDTSNKIKDTSDGKTKVNISSDGEENTKGKSSTEIKELQAQNDKEALTMQVQGEIAENTKKTAESTEVLGKAKGLGGKLLSVFIMMGGFVKRIFNKVKTGITIIKNLPNIIAASRGMNVGIPGLVAEGGALTAAGTVAAGAGIAGGAGLMVHDFMKGKKAGDTGLKLVGDTLVGQTADTLGGMIGNGIKQAVKYGMIGFGVGSFVPVIGNLFGAGTGALIGLIAGMFGSDPSKAMTNIGNAVGKAGKSIGNFINNIGTGIGKLASKVITGLFSLAGKIIMSPFNAITKALDKNKDNNNSMGIIGGLTNLAKGVGSAIISVGKAVIKLPFTIVKSFFLNTINNSAKIAKEIGNTVKEAVSKIFHPILHPIDTVKSVFFNKDKDKDENNKEESKGTKVKKFAKNAITTGVGAAALVGVKNKAISSLDNINTGKGKEFLSSIFNKNKNADTTALALPSADDSATTDDTSTDSKGLLGKFKKRMSPEMKETIRTNNILRMLYEKLSGEKLSDSDVDKGIPKTKDTIFSKFNDSKLGNKISEFGNNVRVKVGGRLSGDIKGFSQMGNDIMTQAKDVRTIGDLKNLASNTKTRLRGSVAHIFGGDIDKKTTIKRYQGLADAKGLTGKEKNKFVKDNFRKEQQLAADGGVVGVVGKKVVGKVNKVKDDVLFKLSGLSYDETYELAKVLADKLGYDKEGPERDEFIREQILLIRNQYIRNSKLFKNFTKAKDFTLKTVNNVKNKLNEVKERALLKMAGFNYDDALDQATAIADKVGYDKEGPERDEFIRNQIASIRQEALLNTKAGKFITKAKDFVFKKLGNIKDKAISLKNKAMLKATGFDYYSALDQANAMADKLGYDKEGPERDEFIRDQILLIKNSYIHNTKAAKLMNKAKNFVSKITDNIKDKAIALKNKAMLKATGFDYYSALDQANAMADDKNLKGEERDAFIRDTVSQLRTEAIDNITIRGKVKKDFKGMFISKAKGLANKVMSKLTGFDYQDAIKQANALADDKGLVGEERDAFINKTISDLKAEYKANGGGILSNTRNTINKVKNFVVGKAKGLANKVMSKLTGFDYQDAVKQASAMADDKGLEGEERDDFILKTVNKMKKEHGNGGIIGSIKDKFNDVKNKAKGKVKNAINDKIEKLKLKRAEKREKLKDKAEKSSLLQEAKVKLKNLLSREKFKNIKEKVREKLKDVWENTSSKISSIGSSIGGMIQGISKAAQAIPLAGKVAAAAIGAAGLAGLIAWAVKKMKGMGKKDDGDNGDGIISKAKKTSSKVEKKAKKKQKEKAKKEKEKEKNSTEEEKSTAKSSIYGRRRFIPGLGALSILPGSNMVGNVLNHGITTVDKLGNNAVNKAGGVLNNTVGTAGNVLHHGVNRAGRVLDNATGIAGNVLHHGVNVVDKLGHGVIDVAHGVVGVGNNIVNTVGKNLPQAISTVGNVANNIVNKVGAGIQNITSDPAKFLMFNSPATFLLYTKIDAIKKLLAANSNANIKSGPMGDNLTIDHQLGERDSGGNIWDGSKFVSPNSLSKGTQIGDSIWDGSKFISTSQYGTEEENKDSWNKLLFGKNGSGKRAIQSGNFSLTEGVLNIKDMASAVSDINSAVNASDPDSPAASYQSKVIKALADLLRGVSAIAAGIGGGTGVSSSDSSSSSSDTSSSSSSVSTDSSSSDSSSSGTLSGGSTEEQVYNFFTSKGYSREAALGIIGNMYGESGCNPAMIQSDGKGPAAGIVQWENYNKKSDRWKSMSDYAASKGKEWTDLQSQLEFLDMELQGKDPTTLQYLKQKVGGYEGFKKIGDIDQATNVFEESFERAGVPRLEARRQYAHEAEGRLKGGTSGTNSTVNTNGSSNSSSNTGSSNSNVSTNTSSTPANNSSATSSSSISTSSSSNTSSTPSTTSVNTNNNLSNTGSSNSSVSTNTSSSSGSSGSNDGVKLVEIAKNEVGYQEKASNSQLDDKTANAGHGNYTKYNHWYGMDAEPWCNMFVSWCADQLGVLDTAIPKSAGCANTWEWYESRGKAHKKGDGYTPQPGDLILRGPGNHIGIVDHVSGDELWTVEGNTSGGAEINAEGEGVHNKKYSLSNNNWYGYCETGLSGTNSATGINTNSNNNSNNGNNDNTSTASSSGTNMSAISTKLNQTADFLDSSNNGNLNSKNVDKDTTNFSQLASSMSGNKFLSSSRQGIGSAKADSTGYSYYKGLKESLKKEADKESAISTAAAESKTDNDDNKSSVNTKDSTDTKATISTADSGLNLSSKDSTNVTATVNTTNNETNNSVYSKATSQPITSYSTSEVSNMSKYAYETKDYTEYFGQIISYLQSMNSGVMNMDINIGSVVENTKAIANNTANNEIKVQVEYPENKSDDKEEKQHITTEDKYNEYGYDPSNLNFFNNQAGFGNNKFNFSDGLSSSAIMIAQGDY